MIDDASALGDRNVRSGVAVVREGAVSALRVATDWRTIAMCCLALALFAALSWPLLTAWGREYVDPEGYYAHAPLIPAIVGLMFWSRRKELQGVDKRPSLWPLIVLAVALPLLVFTTRIFASSLATVAFFLVIWSSIVSLFGLKFFRAAAFPLLFLVTMAPLPGMLLTDCTHGLQDFSTYAAAGLLRLLSFTAVLDGNVIHMQNYSLFVDVPCSGFKILLALLTVNAALAYLFDGSPVKRTILFVLSVPIGLTINTVRIALIGMVGDCMGPAQAQSFHDWSGLLTWTLGVAVVLAIAKGFGCRTFAGWPLF
jgi:exosortase